MYQIGEKMPVTDADGVDWIEEGVRYNRIHHRLKKVANFVNRLYKLYHFSTIFDIGCSGGKLSWLIEPSITYYGCDIVPGVIQENNNDRIVLWNIEQDEIANLNFSQRSFDCIVMSGLLEHVADRKEVLTKAISMINSTGFLILTYANPEFIFYKRNIGIRKNDRNWIMRLLTHKELKLLLKNCNFNILSVYHLIYFIMVKRVPLISRPFHIITNQYIYIAQRKYL